MHIGHRERLRRRFVYSEDSMTGCDLLELLLFYANTGVGVNETAHELLDNFGTLEGVMSADDSALVAIDGMSDASATLIRLVGAINRRLLIEAASPTRIKDQAELTRYAHALLSCEKTEKIVCICLSASGRVVSRGVLADGSPSKATISQRNIAKFALVGNAHAIILAHNHPSGNAEPSHDDIAMTTALENTLASLDIRLYDHVIVSRDEVYSIKNTRKYDPNGNVIE